LCQTQTSFQFGSKKCISFPFSRPLRAVSLTRETILVFGTLGQACKRSELRNKKPPAEAGGLVAG
jgi:hypothetical protein